MRINMTIENNDIVRVYISGACTLQTQCGGWGAVLTREGKRIEPSGSARNTTGNRMFLTAAIQSLSIAQRKNSHKPIIVYTDSHYTIDGITKHIAGWKQSNWRKTNRTPVINADLWQELDSLTQSMNVTWIKSNTANEELITASALARAAKPKK